MVSAGWYQDPSDSNRQRYWDGVQWTEQVQGPPASGLQEQPPVSYGQSYSPQPGQGYAQPHAALESGSGKPVGSGFGEWLGATFSAYIKGFIATVGIMALYGGIFWALLVGLGYSLLDGVVLREDAFGDLDIQGFEVGPALYGLGAVVAIGTILQYAGVISGHHYMYKTHMGGTRSFVGSLGAGLKAVPKYLLFMFAFLVVFGLAFAALVAIGIASDGNVPIVIAVGLAGTLLFFAMTYVAIRLVYVPLVATVAPEGEGFIAASWRASKGRFWPILGRIIVIYFAAMFVGLIGNSLANIVLTAALPFETTNSGQLLLNGVEPNLSDGIRITDFFPSAAGLGIYLLLTIFLQAAQLALFASSNSAMYIQDQIADKLKR